MNSSPAIIPMIMYNISYASIRTNMSAQQAKQQRAANQKQAQQHISNHCHRPHYKSNTPLVNSYQVHTSGNVMK